MLSSRFVTTTQENTDIKVSSFAMSNAGRLNARYFLVFVGLLSLSMQLTSLMAKNEATPVTSMPPLEPPGAVIVTRNSFDGQTHVSGMPPGQVVLPVKVSSVAHSVEDPLISDVNHVQADELVAALERWSEAWSGQDMAAYLETYAPNFLPSNGSGREAWAKQRTARIMSKKTIRHEMRNVDVQLKQNEAIVKFTQVYADGRLNQIDQKTMQWVFSEGRWLITREATN